MQIRINWVSGFPDKLKTNVEECHQHVSFLKKTLIAMESQNSHLKRGLQKARRMNFILMICILCICLILLVYVSHS
jgi:hypothetical protein